MNTIYTVDVITLNSWLESTEAIILDVREPYEYQEGHINGAINIPLSAILVEIDQIKDIQGKKIVLQCKVVEALVSLLNLSSQPEDIGGSIASLLL